MVPPNTAKGRNPRCDSRLDPPKETGW